MASTDDNNGIPPMPALPPVGRIEGHRYRDELPIFFPGQNCPQGAAARSEDTPPYCINVRQSDEPSAMSSLTAPNTAAASADNSK